MGSPDIENLLRLAEKTGALSYGEFRLSAGGTSGYYFDGRLLTLDPEGAHHIASVLLPLLRDCGAQAVGGPTIGADPIVASVAVLSHVQGGSPIPGLIVRNEAKQHGAGRLVEGPLTEGARVAVVDDTCTTGASLLHAIDALEASGCHVVKVICILDRREGGSDEIRRRGYDFAALLEADEEGRVSPSRG
jgi:orotate phosphoribosyltransferase